MSIEIRNQFPALDQEINGYPLVYLDNAATTQVPECVFEAMHGYYRAGHANIDRGVHQLGQRATRLYEQARDAVAAFLGARSSSEIVFVRGTTEAANLVANAYLNSRLNPGDRVVVTEMEHHSNYLPWQQVCAANNARLDVARVGLNGELDIDHIQELLAQPGCKLFAVTHVSNVVGTINPVKELIAVARQNDVRVFVDGAQAVPHLPVDVAGLECDFYAFSGHKVHAPTGIGALYAREEILKEMDPWQTGGGMVLAVGSGAPDFKDAPERFEAGTPNIFGAIGLAEALSFMQVRFSEGLQSYEQDLMGYLEKNIATVDRVQVLASPSASVGVLSFVFDGVHAHDVGTILDSRGIAVRVGHHCAMPLMRRFGVPATVRASLACYNVHSDVDALVEGLGQVEKIFATGRS
jgi:cysteine desulfurase/selenocysteine lyase